MFKNVSSLIFLMLLQSAVIAQLTGTKTIKSAGGDYASFAAAINDLNLNGVGAGGVIFEVDAGFNSTENIPAITATGTSSNTIIFKKVGAGANPVLLPTGGSGTTDFGFKLEGSDYITFESIDVNISTGNAVEFGFWLNGISSSNGCQNNTIKNCTITLNKSNTASKGINATVATTVIDVNGANSNNKYYNVNVSNCYHAIYLVGNTTYADLNTVITTLSGGSSTLSNLGGGTLLCTGVFLSSQFAYQVSNLVINNISTTGTSQLYAIRQTGTLSNGSVFNNTISNLSNSTSGSVYGISISGGGTTQHIYNNTINSISSSTGGVFGVEASNSNATHFMYGNNIYALSTAGTTSTNSAYGITNSGANVNLTIYQNQINNIASNGASASLASGLNVSGTNARIYNNFIFDIRNANGISTPTAPSARGISLNTGTSNFYVYHNSVYLGYTATNASNSSAALFTSAALTADIRNNIFVNNVNITTGTRAVAHYRAATTTTMFTATTDDNLYYAGTPGAKNLIYFDGTNTATTLLDYQNRMVNREWHSVTELPPFISTVPGSINLHLNTGVATQCELGGRPIITPFSVNTDFDGNARPNAYADLGADEGAFTRNDLTGPYISYTPLNNTTLLTGRMLTVTITDPSGVPVSGAGLPMLYWKINNGSYTPVTGVNNGLNTYDFTFGNGVAITDSISYFVAAQDLNSTPNILSHNPVNATGYSATPPNVTTPTTAPSNYKIVFPLATSINVGAGGDYASLTNTGGAFDVIRQGVMTDNITLYIMSDLSIETGNVDLKQWIEEGPGNYNVRIVSVDATPKIISGNSFANGFIRLNGVKNITIDGSFGGVNNILTFRNTNTDGFTPVIYLHNDASSNTIKNSTIEGFITGSTTQLGTVFIGAGLVNGCDSNIIDNNIIRNISGGTLPTNIGIYVIGKTGVINTFNSFINNQIFNFGTYGFKSNEGNENTIIRNNTFYQVLSNPGNTTIGIDLGSAGNNIVSGNTIRDLKATTTPVTIAGMFIQNAGNTSLYNNRLYDFSAATGSIYGIYFAGSSGNPIKLTAYNNQISFIPAGNTNQLIYGIADESFAANTIEAFYNSIYIGGNSNAATNSWCYRRATFGAGASSNFIRNNIMYNNRTGTGIHYAIGDAKAAQGVFIVSNNFYIGKGSPVVNQIFERSAGVSEDFASWIPARRDISSYAEMQTSQSENQLFIDVAICDLKIRNDIETCWYVNGKGLPLTGIDSDFEGSIRSAILSQGSTDIGADEFGTSTTPAALTITGTHAPGMSESFSFGGRTLATIQWAAGGSLPVLGNVRHYTGVWPNDTTNNGTTTGARFLNEWFDIPATGGSGYSYNITLNYDSCMLGTINNEATMIMQKKQSGIPGSWVIVNSNNPDVNTKNISANALTSFSEFTAADLLASLPVDGLKFYAVKNNPDIDLKWEVAAESNNIRYEIQRSLNGVNFEKIGTVNRIGTTQNRHYAFNDPGILDLMPQVKTFYYRLAILDNGSLKYSPVVMVRSDKNNSDWVQAVFPNPFINKINLSLLFVKSANLSIRLLESNGKVILQQQHHYPEGIHVLDIDLGNKPSGVYHLEITDGKDKKVFSLVKK